MCPRSSHWLDPGAGCGARRVQCGRHTCRRNGRDPCGYIACDYHTGRQRLVFRTVPSTNIRARFLHEPCWREARKRLRLPMSITTMAKGFAEAFRKEFEAKGGNHCGLCRPRGKSRLLSLGSCGPRPGCGYVLLIDLGDTSGLTMLRESIENDFFKTYVGGEGMKSAQTFQSHRRCEFAELLCVVARQPAIRSADPLFLRLQGCGGRSEMRSSHRRPTTLFSCWLWLSKPRRAKRRTCRQHSSL